MSKIKTIIGWIGLSILSFHALANTQFIYEDHSYELKITKSTYNFYENYEINSPSSAISTTGYTETYPGTAQKSAFRIRTNYDLYNQDGWQATGITRVLSLGSLYSWAKQIDVYDNKGVVIGMIDGNLATMESAKFSIYRYNSHGEAREIAVAIANQDFSQFSITTDESYRDIGELRRNRVDGSWSVIINTPKVIDDRIVRIFATFVIDYEDKFM